MTVTSMPVSRTPRPSSLADVLDVILDKGIVIDVYVRVSLVGIEILTIDARIVIASVDTYLRFAEAVNRLDLQPRGQVAGLPGLVEGMTEGTAKTKTKGALTGVKEKASEVIQSVRGDSEDEEDQEPQDREAQESGDQEDGEREPVRRRAPADRRPPAGREPRS